MADPTEKPPNDHPDETPFQRFQKTVRKIVSVPKTEIERRDAEWRKRKGDKEKRS